MRMRYITKNALQEGGDKKKKRKKKEDGCNSYHPWKLSPLSTKESRRRRISSRTKLEDKLLPFLHAFDHSISLWSCSVVEVLTKAQFLSPFSLLNLLYRTRWVWAHLPNSKEPPNSGPYNWRRLWESCSCDDECNGLLRQDRVPEGRLWWSVYCTTRGELPGGLQLNRPLAPCACPLPPPRVKPPWISLDWGKWRPREALQGGSVVGLVLEDRYWYLLTHWSGWMGL